MTFTVAVEPALAVTGTMPCVIVATVPAVVIVTARPEPLVAVALAAVAARLEPLAPAIAGAAGAGLAAAVRAATVRSVIVVAFCHVVPFHPPLLSTAVHRYR